MGFRMVKALEDAIGLAADVARHVAWFVVHQVQPSPRERDD
jgi:flavin-binding protein dodecin